MSEAYHNTEITSYIPVIKSFPSMNDMVTLQNIHIVILIENIKRLPPFFDLKHMQP